MKKRPGLLIPLLLGIMSTAQAGHPLEGESVRDPAYGEALFQLHRGDGFGALARLLAARRQGELRRDGEQARLIIEWLRRREGLPTNDDERFDRLLRARATAAARARAWWEIGRARYRRGDYAAAVAALRKGAKALPSRYRARHALLLAQALMHLGEEAAAARVLRTAGKLPPPWDAYGRYNLAMSLLGSGQADRALKTLDALGRLDSTDEERLALRDKANVALGYAYLERKEAANAKRVLNRVRLNGPFSARALLGLGWAEWLNDQPRLAQVVWNKLQNGNPADPMVQEALLGIPQTLWQLESHTQASKRFRDAIAIYERELRRLTRLMENIDDQRDLPRLLEADSEQLPALLHASPLAPYLEGLLSEPRFQASRQRYHELLGLRARLAAWDERLAGLPGEQGAALRPRLEKLRRHLQRARLDQQDYLRTLVLDELARQQQRLQDYLITARYGLARLLDELASAAEEPPR